ncbi:hypothetical protein D0962_18060 [Leptolyngbyaceae cyanobacterium CCMR0082]|uniref:Uncharacterized protein n=1 Tax=Adonisia turfae CCMR0082 TaxID=2304604 RepID=A0A6M0S8D4_9CYAN|nr:hypothetical protein [Adonisia turfae]NEZ64669.1 hypothetical protein [Adonisia turfae CCMR0082]
MERYRTRHYVAITWADALRLAGLDGTPVENIIRVSDVELIHRTEWWAWWSDLKITTAFGLPQDLQLQGLSPDAAHLISEAWESDVLEPECGWPLLAEIRQILNRAEIWRGEQRGQYQPETWERLRVVLEADREAILYRVDHGYEDGYYCDFTCDLPSGLIDLG